MTVVLGPCSHRVCTVYIDGPLLSPLKSNLLTRVRALVRRGARTIVLDMSRVSLIDAAGVGELVRTYNIACRMNVRLRIVHTTKWVRATLARVGLFDLLSDSECG